GQDQLKPFIEELSAQESAIFYGFSSRVFENLEHYGFESADEAAEVFIQYKDRIRTIVRKSTLMKEKSDVYLDVCTCYLAKSLHRSRRKRELLDFVLEGSGESISYTCLSPPSSSSSLASNRQAPDADCDENRKNLQFIADIPPSFFLQDMVAGSKRLLYLVVKCAWEVDDAIAQKAAYRIGVPEAWLQGMLQQARVNTESARICRSQIDERINATWIDILLIETQLSAEDLRPEQRTDLLRRFRAKKNRYDALLEKRARCRLLVPNRIIASLLHVPKGSVDSGLYYLKGKWKPGIGD
ncbi:MAG: hypothetical protein LLF89_05160, partial [Spirochaetaceae bacterium]|nr:hypothetical protein [Spirochaetaceae bacterium]